jgi:protein-disulfide isomerase
MTARVRRCGGYTPHMQLIRRAALLGLVFAAVGVVLLLLSGSSSSKPTPSMDGNFTPVAPTLIPADGLATDHGLGAVDAPVVLTVWTDYQCPICGAWANGVEPLLYERYVTEGKLRIEHRHYSFLGEESFTAAVGAECAAKQDLFWNFHSHVFANQNGENEGAFSAERLRKIAEASGVDLAAWDSCIADPAVRAGVNADAEEAQALGITGTPTLILGDWMDSGIPASDDLYARIDAALGK